MHFTCNTPLVAEAVEWVAMTMTALVVNQQDQAVARAPMYLIKFGQSQAVKH
jgi:hypothetical protein